MAPAPEITNPQSPTLTMPASSKQANALPSSTLVLDIEALLSELDAKELQAVQDYINRKKKENEEAAAERRAAAEQTPEERRAEEKQRAEERREEKKRRAEERKAEKKKKRPFTWSWRRNREPDDEEIGVARLPQCYEEIKNLLGIEKSPNPIYAKALEEWSKKETLFTNRVERKKKKVANLKNEIYQLIGFFSVFQGVLLTAVSQSNLLHCNNWWSPILLSVVASVVTIFGVVQKLMQITAFQKTIHSEEQTQKVVINRLNTLRRQGVHNFKFAKFLNWKPKRQSTHRFWIYFWLVIGSLLVFTVGFPLSHWRILCYPGSNPYAAPVPSSQ